MTVELPQVAAMSEDDRAAAIDAVTLKSKEQLIEWQRQTGRTWMILDAIQFVESLDFPRDLLAYQQMLAKYRARRATIPTGRVEVVTDPKTGEQRQVPIMHGEQLEVVEATRLMRYLLDTIREKDPTWTLAQL